MNSDSSYEFPFTISDFEKNEQEFDEFCLERDRALDQRKAEEARLRRQDFSQHSITYIESELSLAGFKLLTFRETKIKFYLEPSKVSAYVTKKAIFYVSLRYLRGYWGIKRDSLPVNLKWPIAQMFYGRNNFPVDDSKIFITLRKIHDAFVEWSRENGEIRRRKFERFKMGEVDYVELNEDDEELFLTDEERIEFHEKRLKVLRRMIPPPGGRQIRLI